MYIYLCTSVHTRYKSKNDRQKNVSNLVNNVVKIIFYFIHHPFAYTVMRTCQPLNRTATDTGNTTKNKKATIHDIQPLRVTSLYPMFSKERTNCEPLQNKASEKITNKSKVDR